MENFMHYYKWTEEDTELVRLLALEGLSARQISIETGLSESRIKKEKTVLIGGSKRQYTSLPDAELLEILKASNNKCSSYFNSKDSGTPSATIYIKRFGSWNNALNLAGIPTNKCSMKEGVPTIVYLLEFSTYYKVGVTQQSVLKRFYGYPEYTVLMEIETSLEEAKKIEKDWLNSTRDYRYLATDFPLHKGGQTECFVYS